MRSRLTPGVLVLSLLLAVGAGGQSVVPTKELTDLAGTSGLWLHLGCGREGSATLTADLAGAGDIVIHGLATDDAYLERARKAIAEKGAAGRAMAEKAPAGPLPYLRDLANVVVLEDKAAAAARGWNDAEIQRVLAPGGALCVKDDGGKWIKTVKPWPKGMDQWTHPFHGPDANMVSNDAIVALPLGYRWLAGLPCSLTSVAGTRGWVIADGRAFVLSINDTENLSLARGKEPTLWLSGRDAFNGRLLWRMDTEIPEGGTSIGWMNTGALATDGKAVFTAVKNSLVAVDAASGRVLHTYPTKHAPAKILRVGDVVVAACWEGKENSKDDLSFLWVPSAGGGTIEAYDAQSGQARWSLPLAAFRIMSADGMVYALVREGNPTTERLIVAIDLASGAEKWRVAVSKLGTTPQADLVCCGRGIVVVAKEKERENIILSAKDGSVLWRAKGMNWAAIVGDSLWAGSFKYDPLTGKSKGAIGTYMPHQHCSPAAIVGNIITRPPGGSFMQLSGEAGAKPKGFDYHGVRAACAEGIVPANGMFYSAQNNCKCIPGATFGFVAYGPIGAPPETKDFEAGRPVEKGPAFGQSGVDAKADDWPTYRHDARRSAATSGVLPENLKVAWSVPLVKPATGALAEDWRSQLTNSLSAPVVANGLAFAAATDEGRLIAVDAASGKPAWSVLLGGRIDTPPTIYRGLCLVGCHDGWVYALRATDGALAWRTRVAPWERRMVAYSAVESVWPATGSVLVVNDTAYVTAGRSSESDGGIALAALDPMTGDMRWCRAIEPGGLRTNDILSAGEGGNIRWRHLEFDAKNGKLTRPTSMPTLKEYGGGAGRLEGPMIDGSWTFLANRKSGHAFQLGTIRGSVMAAGAKTIVTDAGAFAADSGESLWKTGRSPKQIESMVLADNAVLLAGRVVGPKPLAEGKGFIAIRALADGKVLAEISLDFAPAYDGVAVAGGRVYVSLRNGTIVCLEKAP